MTWIGDTKKHVDKAVQEIKFQISGTRADIFPLVKKQENKVMETLYEIYDVQDGETNTTVYYE